jgi:hypothetical protein
MSDHSTTPQGDPPTGRLDRLRGLGVALRDRYLPADWPALRLLLALYLLLQLTGIGWDLPASFEWENDGVAPRDFFAGIVHNLPPGSGHTYPLLHNLLLGLLSLPVLLVSVATAPAWTGEAISAHILGYPTMTPVYLLAKLLTLAMSTVALGALARIVARCFNRRAALLATLFAMSNLSVAYYGRTVNLDGPYLFWMALAADRLLDLFERGEWRDYRAFALLVAASIATKDQAYAAWIITAPLLLVALPALRPSALAAGAAHWRLLLRAAGIGLLGLGAMGGALWNPPGFLQRLHKLTGPASQDWRAYDQTVAGVVANLRDLLASLPATWWPLPVLLLTLAGLLLTARWPAQGSGRSAMLLRLLPLLLAISHLLCFTLVVGRLGHRFTMPAGFWLAAYAGVAADALFARFGRPARVAMATLWLWAIAQTLSVQVAQWSDARFEVERWLRTLPAGTRINIAGPVVPQPRWGLGRLAALHVSRLGPQQPKRRNPLPGVTEVKASLDELTASMPEVVVVPELYVRTFLPRELEEGERLPAVVTQKRAGGGEALFAQVHAGTLPGYTVQLIPNGYPNWMGQIGLPLPHVHSSVGEAIYLIVRNDAGLELPRR